ncbi:MAG: tryptophan 2,3-dioxygenase family protein [Saprospiraceae bacterium]|nr:tryptophan 2,3-dioxygenase family protein [Saprospiraceae bacterium]
MTLSMDPQTNAQLSALADKYAMEGKEMSSYLEKLLHEKNLDYSDYLNLDTLLTLQKPRSGQPDEMIFITYHQIVELYFGLMIWEIKQVTKLAPPAVEPEAFYEKICRINRYIQILVGSFQVILQGMDKEQFQKFRNTLFPASGSQSYQYRLIEIYMSDLKNLVSIRSRDEVENLNNLALVYDHLYWKKGMTNPRTGKKSPTLLDFENRYNESLYQEALAYQEKNVWQIFIQYYSDHALTGNLVEALRQLDELFNVYWCGLHYSVVVKHLTSDDHSNLQSTGSTHWPKYLHPNYRKVIFFPKLWSEQEVANWGAKEPWNPAQPIPNN